jgi:hypothetical protein
MKSKRSDVFMANTPVVVVTCPRIVTARLVPTAKPRILQHVSRALRCKLDEFTTAPVRSADSSGQRLAITLKTDGFAPFGASRRKRYAFRMFGVRLTSICAN